MSRFLPVGRDLRCEASRMIGNSCSPLASAARRHDEVALFVIPAVAEVEFNRRRIALLEDLPQFRLVVLFENLDRADVIAEDADVPFVAIEIGERNASVVLHDGLAMTENEIANAVEALFKHQIGR